MNRPINCGTQNHQPAVLCASTMPTMLAVPASISTPMIETPRGTSYETIWAALRSEPRSEYLLLQAQPPGMVPYTPSEVIDRMYSTPMFTSVTYGVTW